MRRRGWIPVFLAVAIAAAPTASGQAAAAPGQATPAVPIAAGDYDLLTADYLAGKRSEARESPSTMACGRVAWQSTAANLRYVRVETGYSGRNDNMLRAMSTSVGAREQFLMCFSADDSFTLKSYANNLYVTVETSYPSLDYGMLRARSATVGTAQRFIYTGSTRPTWWWKSKANNRWVQTAIGYGGIYQNELRAAVSVANPTTSDDVTIRYYRPFA